jgi:DNA-binding SARP family transcriptional activator
MAAHPDEIRTVRGVSPGNPDPILTPRGWLHGRTGLISPCSRPYHVVDLARKIRVAALAQGVLEHENVLHLRTLGTLDLHSSGGASDRALLVQPGSMALLVYLLLARPMGYLRRDTVCALFWPEADEEHARGALSQALSRIRRLAGAELLEVRGKSELRVDPAAVACDVPAFEAAFAAGDHAAAMELYAGPFLQGFHLPHAPGFEDWAVAERDRLRSIAGRAAHARALEHLAGRRLADAGIAAARAVALAPERESVACDLVRSQWAAGDRPGALRLYESWAAMLARELELEPSEDAQALAGQLRATSTALGGEHADTAPYPDPLRSTVAAAPPSGPGLATTEPVGGGPLEDAGDDGRLSIPTSSGAPAAPSAVSLHRRAATGTAAGLGLILCGWLLMNLGLLSAGVRVEARGRTPVELTPRDWLVVADFEAQSVDPALALAFQTLLVRDLESTGYTAVVGGLGALSRRSLEDVLTRMRLPPDTPIDTKVACEIAEREGAAGVLAGRVLPLGEEYILVASVLGVDGCQELIRVSAVGGFDRLSLAVMAVSRELRKRLGESRSSIRSSPALPAAAATYVEALRAMSHYISTTELWDDPVRGAAPLLEALRIEPDLAAAHFLLAIHYQRLGQYALAVPHLVRAFELRDQLPRAGRMGMEALYQRYIASDPFTAMAAVETISREFPAIADATMPFLADAALWIGDWKQSLDVSLEYLGRGPGGLGAHLAYSRASTAAWALGRVELADSLHRAVLTATANAGLEPDRTVLLLHHLRHRDWDGADELCARHPGWDRCAHLHLARGRLAAAGGAFEDVLVGDTMPRHPWERAAVTAALTHAAVLSGRPDSAWNLLDRADRELPMVGPSRAGMHLSRFLLCSAAAGLGRSQELPECRIEEEDPATWDADPSFTLVLRTGAWSRRLLAVRSLERGDPAVALVQARAAVRSNFGNPTLVDHLIQALALDALGHHDEALVRYGDVVAFERDVAVPTAAGVLFPLAPVYRRMGELAEGKGDIVAAATYLEAFLRLWAGADQDLQPQVRAAREHLERWGNAGATGPPPTHSTSRSSKRR